MGARREATEGRQLFGVSKLVDAPTDGQELRDRSFANPRNAEQEGFLPTQRRMVLSMLGDDLLETVDSDLQFLQMLANIVFNKSLFTLQSIVFLLKQRC